MHVRGEKRGCRGSSCCPGINQVGYSAVGVILQVPGAVFAVRSGSDAPEIQRVSTIRCATTTSQLTGSACHAAPGRRIPVMNKFVLEFNTITQSMCELSN